MIYDTSRGDSASFALSLSNVGVGPARMQAMQLSLDGEPVSDWQTLVDTLLGEPAMLGTDFGKSSVRRRVLAPGESVTAFQTEHMQLALKLQQAVHSGVIGLAYCYCSIFDECWTKPASDPTGDDPIEPVEACTDYGGYGFKD